MSAVESAACIENCTDTVYSCVYQSAEYYGYLYIYTPVAVVGVVFNCFNLRVLARTSFKGCMSTFTFLRAMAVADLLCLILVSPIGIIRCANQSYEWQHYTRQVYEIYIYLPIANSFACASVWITMTVAIERYITITRMALAKQICTKFYARWTIFFIYISAIAINFPYHFYRRVSDTVCREYTDFASGEGFQVFSWLRTCLAKYIPIVIVSVFNILMLVTVCAHNRKRRCMVFPQSSIQRRQQLQTKCTAMLLSITITFVLCHILEPFIHSAVYTSLFGYCSLYTITYRTIAMFVNLLETFSYAINFIFYCVFNKDFASRMKEMLKCKCMCVYSNKTEHQENTVASQVGNPPSGAQKAVRFVEVKECNSKADIADG